MDGWTENKAALLLLVTMKLRVWAASSAAEPAVMLVAQLTTVRAPLFSATVWLVPRRKEGGLRGHLSFLAQKGHLL